MKISSSRSASVALLLALWVSALAAAPSPAGSARRATARMPCRAWGEGERFTLDLHEVPLRDIARIVSCAAETRVIFAPAKLSAISLTVISARPVDRGALIGLWYSLLAEHGLTSERHGAYERVQPVGS